jgi:hypothetical protein
MQIPVRQRGGNELCVGSSVCREAANILSYIEAHVHPLTLRSCNNVHRKPVYMLHVSPVNVCGAVLVFVALLLLCNLHVLVCQRTPVGIVLGGKPDRPRICNAIPGDNLNDVSAVAATTARILV